MDKDKRYHSRYKIKIETKAAQSFLISEMALSSFGKTDVH